MIATQPASISLASEITEEWCRAGEIAHGQKEFFVVDPGGYLYRFSNISVSVVPNKAYMDYPRK